MKKLLVMVMVMIMAAGVLVSCSGGGSATSTGGESATQTENSGVSSSNKSIDGKWIIPAEDGEPEESITIDGDSAVIMLIGTYKGTVDRDNSTITFDDGTIMTYEVIGDKLVLSSDTTSTLAFERAKE